MILRAIFWIGLVSLLMPHEPDLGLGRPGSPLGPTSMLPHAISGLFEKGEVSSSACRTAGCARGLSILDGLQARMVHSLDQVRADIDASRRLRDHSAI